MIPNKKHQIFAEEYILTNDAIVSYQKALVDAGWLLKQQLIWVKNSMVMGRQDYQWKHEPCLYGWLAGDSHKWYSDRKQTTVWNFDRPTKSELHPTMKPVPLIAYPIKNSSSKTITTTFRGRFLEDEALAQRVIGMYKD